MLSIMTVLTKKEMVKQDIHLECKHLTPHRPAQYNCFSDKAGRRGSQGKQNDDFIGRIALGKMFLSLTFFNTVIFL